MKRLFYSIALVVLAASCGKDPQGGGNDSDNGENGTGATGGVSEVIAIQSDITIDLNTDKAIYKPGETVRFTAENMPSDVKIRYRSMGRPYMNMTRPAMNGPGRRLRPMGEAIWWKFIVRRTKRPILYLEL